MEKLFINTRASSDDQAENSPEVQKQKGIEAAIHHTLPIHISFAMSRKITIGLLFLTLVSCKTDQNSSSDPEGYIYSVQGKVGVENLGFSLTHEHVMSRFGLDPAYIGEYDKDSLFTQVVPYLKEVKALGVKTIFDCTTAYFGRNVSYLKEISDITGVEIITNTGYYAGANDRYVPESAYRSSIEEIAEIWIDEFENGIDETGIKPGGS